MKPACEYVSKEVLPAVRAIMAKKMIADHSLTQTQVAAIMEMTQPAISQYKRELRGRRIRTLKEDPEVIARIGEIVRRLVTGSLARDEAGREFCSLCRLMQSRGIIPEEYRCHAEG
jgi:predicted transcriptional regulator